MAFGNKSTVPCRQYKYYCRCGPITAQDEVLKQMRLAHEFRNTLVQLELDRRELLAPVLEAQAVKTYKARLSAVPMPAFSTNVVGSGVPIPNSAAVSSNGTIDVRSL